MDGEGAFQVGMGIHVIGGLSSNRNVGNNLPRSRRVHQSGTIPVGREGVEGGEWAYRVGMRLHAIGRLRTNRNVGNIFPRSRRIHENGTIPVGREGKDWIGRGVTSVGASTNVIREV